MVENVYKLYLTPAELALIASWLGAPLLQFTENPFHKRSPDEIKRALDQAQVSLTSRQYLQVQVDGTIGLDTGVAAIVGALAFAKSSLVISRTVRENAPCFRHIFYVSGLIVERQQTGEAYCLTPICNQDKLIRRLVEFLCLENQVAAPGQPVELDETEFKEAHLIATVEGKNTCVEYLKGIDIPSVTAQSLAETLSHSLSQNALLAMRSLNQESKVMGKLGLLEGASGLWLLQYQKANQADTRLTPCDASTAISQLRELVDLIMKASKK